MRHRAGLIVLLGSLLAGPDLAACGDKFLVVGRGTRFQRGAEAARPYAVLIYAPRSSPLAERRQRSSVEKTLLRAGYRPGTAGSSGELAERLKSGAPDVVVANVSDAREVESRLGGVPSPVVLLEPAMGAAAILDAMDAAVRRMTRPAVAAAAKP